MRLFIRPRRLYRPLPRYIIRSIYRDSRPRHVRGIRFNCRVMLVRGHIQRIWFVPFSGVPKYALKLGKGLQ